MFKNIPTHFEMCFVFGVVASDIPSTRLEEIFRLFSTHISCLWIQVEGRWFYIENGSRFILFFYAYNQQNFQNLIDVWCETSFDLNQHWIKFISVNDLLIIHRLSHVNWPRIRPEWHVDKILKLFSLPYFQFSLIVWVMNSSRERFFFCCPIQHR